jgi:hypothetical protein
MNAENPNLKLPDIGVRPLLLFAVGGALLAYLFAQHPEMALRPIEALPEALASAMPTPSLATCTTASDCRTGCQCTGGQCTPCSAAKPKPVPPQKNKPRLVATLDGEICADCLALPQMLTPLETFPARAAD